MGSFRIRVEKDHTVFSAGHFITYDGHLCEPLHGHNYRVAASVEGPLDENFYVLDFTRIKRQLRTIVDRLDHRMLLHRNDPVLPFLQAQGEPIFLCDANPTAETIARLIYDYTRSQGFPVVEVRLWETDDSCAVYRPS